MLGPSPSSTAILPPSRLTAPARVRRHSTYRLRMNGGHVLGAVIDVLERRPDVDGARVGVVGQSLGALYAPLAAAGEPRLRACIANCGPFDWGTVLPKMPKVSQEVFRVRSHSSSIEECYERGKAETLEGRSQNIECPLLVIFGAGDRLIPHRPRASGWHRPHRDRPNWSSFPKAIMFASTSATSFVRLPATGWLKRWDRREDRAHRHRSVNNRRS